MVTTVYRFEVYERFMTWNCDSLLTITVEADSLTTAEAEAEYQMDDVLGDGYDEPHPVLEQVDVRKDV